MMALAEAAAAAEMAQTMALAEAAAAAEMAQTMALAEAAAAAEMAQTMALAEAAAAAEMAQTMALAEAAAAAEMAQTMALAEAAAAAEMAQTMALAEAAAAAEETQTMALAEAAMAAEETQRMALETAAMAAEETQRMALETAAMAAEETKRMALETAAMAAEETQRMALETAAMAAEEAKRMALETAAMAAEEAKRLAVALAVGEALGEAGVTSALDAYDRANVALRTAHTEYASDTSSLDKANAYKKYADSALVAAQSAKAVADAAGNTAQMEAADRALDAATGAVRSAGNAVTFATNTTMTTADAIAVAMAITADIGTEGPFDADENNNMIGVTRDRAGVKVTVMDVKGTAATDDDTSVDADGDPVLLRGLHKSVHTAENEDDMTSEMTVVYSDIDAPGPQNYDDYYGVAQTGVTGTVANDGELDLDEIASVVQAAAGLYSAPNFPEVGDQVKSYTTLDDPETDEDESDESTFAGMFNTVPGMYSCTTNNDDPCGATADKEGNLLTLTGMWTFTPTDTEYKIQGVVADADHLYYGYWLKTEPGDDGDEYTFQAFSGGMVDFVQGSVENVTGKASYSGTAAGRYVEKSDFDQAGNGRVAVTGAFTARAKLTANFNAGSAVAVNDHYSISGTVDRFVNEESGEGLSSVAGDAWVVNLKTATFGDRDTGTGVVTSHTNDWSGVAQGTGNAGTWSGQFFGPADDEGDTIQPSGVAGEFAAHFNNGHVAGAFGAEKD